MLTGNRNYIHGKCIANMLRVDNSSSSIHVTGISSDSMRIQYNKNKQLIYFIYFHLQLKDKTYNM